MVDFLLKRFLFRKLKLKQAFTISCLCSGFFEFLNIIRVKVDKRKNCALSSLS